MKALILGASGQVGTALSRAAPPHAEIVTRDRLACDVRDADQVERELGARHFDVVFNAAAYTAVDRAEVDAESAYLLNAHAPGILAAAARRHGVRTIHISTDFVFDGESGHAYSPEDEPRPLSVYGASKLAGERAVSLADPAALIVRTAWVYAPGGSNFVATMLRLMETRDEIRVVADQVGTPTRARSLADALWAMAAGGASGIHHFTDAGVASWYDFAVAIGEEGVAAGLVSRPVRILPIGTGDYPTPARRPAFSVLDKSTTWNLLGQAAPHWRHSLRHHFQDLMAHG